MSYDDFGQQVRLTAFGRAINCNILRPERRMERTSPFLVECSKPGLEKNYSVLVLPSDIFEYGGSVLRRIGTTDNFSRAVTAIFPGLMEQ